VRVIVGGIGYRNLRDHSVGVAVAEHLALRDWPEGVVVEDLSYGPVAVLQRLEDEPPERRFGRAVLVSAVQREGRLPGTVTAYRWDGVLPPEDVIQRAVTEAVTGVIFLDNTVLVTGYFGVLPADVAVVEVEPLVHEMGDAFSAPVAAIFDDVCGLVTTLATDADAVAALPRAPLGGGAPRRAEAR
jgi:hydrogenase maturation protease